MASTFTLFFNLSGVLGSKLEHIGELYAPYTISTSADIISDRIVSVADTTFTEVCSIGSGDHLASAVAIVIIPSTAGMLTWEGASGADNSALQMRAGIPFILPTGNTAPYQTTSSNRSDETAAAITSIGFYQASGGAATVRVFGIG